MVNYATASRIFLLEVCTAGSSTNWFPVFVSYERKWNLKFSGVGFWRLLVVIYGIGAKFTIHFRVESSWSQMLPVLSHHNVKYSETSLKGLTFFSCGNYYFREDRSGQHILTTSPIQQSPENFRVVSSIFVFLPSSIFRRILLTALPGFWIFHTGPYSVVNGCGFAVTTWFNLIWFHNHSSTDFYVSASEGG